MGLAHSPKVVINGILLNVDPGNIKGYDKNENIFESSENFTYAVNSWLGTNVTITSNTVMAPDGTLTASKFTADSGTAGYLSNPINLTAGQNYTVSIYAKKAELDSVTLLWYGAWFNTGNSSIHTYTNFNLTTGTSTAFNSPLAYGMSDAGNGWYRCWMTSNCVAGGTLVYAGQHPRGGTAGDGTNGFYIWGAQLEGGSTLTSYTETSGNLIARGSVLKSTTGSEQFTLYNPAYWSYDPTYKAITFNRTTSPTAKLGGIAIYNTTGNLLPVTFLYNDHTWEVWFRINDITAGNYDGTEGYSILAAYKGYHSGFMYNSNTLYYFIWDNTGPTNKWASTWTVGTSGAQVNQGSWYQIAVTKSGNVCTPYLNGQQVGVGLTFAFTLFNSVTNNLCLGATQINTGVSYSYYSKSTIANMKMYNRALSSEEIQQNFSALRGRFEI